MNVRQIIEKHLTKEGADGLILPYVISGCEGCHGKDLMVCQTYPWRIEDCVPAILKDGKLVPMPEKGREVKHTNNCASCPRQNCNEVYHRDGSCRPDSFGKMTKEAKEKPYVPFMNRLSKKDKAIFRAGMAKLRKRFNQKHPNKKQIQETTNPQVLAEVLRRGKDDDVSLYAAINPHCPPEVLAEILRRGKDDGVFRVAAFNPNCPPEILAEVLRRGKDDWVSWNAASNPNCPSEVLAEVLRRGNDDYVSRKAAENPHCPSEVLAEVLRRGNDDDVSRDAAENPHCPKHILKQLQTYKDLQTIKSIMRRNKWSHKNLDKLLCLKKINK